MDMDNLAQTRTGHEQSISLVWMPKILSMQNSIDTS